MVSTLINLDAMKTKALRELDRQHVDKGTLVMVNAPDEMRVSKFNGQKGKIVELNCETNPIPTIELERSGKRLAVELKHLIYPKQASLF